MDLQEDLWPVQRVPAMAASITTITPSIAAVTAATVATDIFAVASTAVA